MGRNSKNGNLPKRKTVSINKPVKSKSLFSNPKIILVFAAVAVLLIVGGAFAIIKSQNKETPTNAVVSRNTASKPQDTTITDKSVPTTSPTSSTEVSKQTKDVSIMTDKGEIVVELRPDLMPITVNNFMKLVNKGFYNGLKFHRVADWLIQGGDPEGTGNGGPGWTIKLETNPQLKNIKYAIAMARRTEPDTAGSQFYILKQDESSLDGKYAVFGNVIKGQDVVDKIVMGDKMTTVKEIK